MTLAPKWPRLRPGSLALGLALLLLGRTAVAASATNYAIDQRYGSVGFSVSELGLFDTNGDFRKFAGRLAIDPADPARTKIDVAIDVASVAMSSARAVKLVLSPAFFDVQQHPAIRFQSTSVAVAGHDRYLISGMLRIRGVSHPQQLVAVLTTEKTAGKNPPTAYFTVTGKLHRSQYGMTANENFLGDIVRLVIHIHLALPTIAKTN